MPSNQGKREVFLFSPQPKIAREVAEIYAKFDGELRKKAEQTNKDGCRGTPRCGVGVYASNLKSYAQEAA